MTTRCMMAAIKSAMLMAAATIGGTFCFSAHAAVDDSKGMWEDVAPQSISSSCKRGVDAVQGYLHTLPSTSLMVVQNGKVLTTYGRIDKPSLLYSMRKSILAMLYGRYVESGKIDLDRTMAQLNIDDIGGLLPIERTATVRDLITARSGVYHPASNPGDDSNAAPPRGSQKPGTYFLYNNWDFNAAGTVYEQLTQQDIYRSFAEQIAGPTKMEDFDLQKQHRSGDATRSQHLAYHFYLSTRDMARIGQLMLQHGRWSDQQLVSPQWADTITQPVTMSKDMHPHHAAERHFSYGYLWWIAEEPSSSPLAGTYTAWGLHGQFIMVVPKLNMVIAHKRDVPRDAKEPISKVEPQDMLHVASMLNDAGCGATEQTASQASTALH